MAQIGTGFDAKSARNSGAVDPSPDNSNRLIRTDLTSNSFVYPGAFGVKTGTTNLAGRCLVSAANNAPGVGSVIAVVLGAANNADRYQDTKIILDFGLSLF